MACTKEGLPETLLWPNRRFYAWILDIIGIIIIYWSVHFAIEMRLHANNGSRRLYGCRRMFDNEHEKNKYQKMERKARTTYVYSIYSYARVSWWKRKRQYKKQTKKTVSNKKMVRRKPASCDHVWDHEHGWRMNARTSTRFFVSWFIRNFKYSVWCLSSLPRDGIMFERS